MNIRNLTRLLCALLFVAVAGCKDQAPPPPSITGNWSGTTSTGITITLLLSQSGSTVTGTGQSNGPGGGAAHTVAGTYLTPNVSLTISSDEFESFNFSGTHNGNFLNGQLNGSGFDNRPINFARQ